MTGIKDAYLGDTLARDFPAFQAHSTTSREAAQSIAPRLPALQQRVLDYFKSNQEGATDEMLIDALHLNASTLRPRRIELVQQGLLKDSGRYATGRSNRRATVWVLNERQSDRVEWTTLMPPV